MRRLVIGAALLAALAFANVAASAAPTSVVVTIPPQAFFVERIGGDRVDVHVLVGPGQSPHSYEPTPKQMTRLAESDVYFTTGMPFEEALVRRIRDVAPELVVVATDYPVPKRPVTEHDEHGSHAHDGGRLDPHVWMDPRLVKIQSGVIAETLARLDPSHAEEYAENRTAFAAELDTLDARIREALAPLEGGRLYVFHAAFGYFAGAYGLTQVPVETGGKEPGARQLADLIERARRDGARVIFVQPQFSTKAAEAVAEAIDGAVVAIDPLARDYVANLELIADKVASALREDTE
jgi:zinc transport system substrate-binding protein